MEGGPRRHADTREESKHQTLERTQEKNTQHMQCRAVSATSTRKNIEFPRPSTFNIHIKYDYKQVLQQSSVTDGSVARLSTEAPYSNQEQKSKLNQCSGCCTWGSSHHGKWMDPNNAVRSPANPILFPAHPTCERKQLQADQIGRYTTHNKGANKEHDLPIECMDAKG